MRFSWANDPDREHHESLGAAPDGTRSTAGWGSDLFLDLSGPGGPRASLTRALREAVRGGRLTPGTRLPPSRSLAADLGIARNTVADAYAELVAEGWLTARQGSGTHVAALLPHRPAVPNRRPARRAAGVDVRRPAGTVPPFDGRVQHDLRPGLPDLSDFPRAAWLAASRRALQNLPAGALGYDDQRGHPALRRELADYLARSRGVRADPERIVVSSGMTQGIALLGAVLAGAGVRQMAVESYGLGTHRDALAGAGLHTVPLPVDRDGARIPQLADHPEVRAVLLTAAHQFPTGATLHPDRRSAVVDWARRTDGVVLEDDYDGEFRHGRRLVGALQGLDPERVVYLGTASKSLAPGLRLAWMVLPDRLVDPVLRTKSGAGWATGVFEQLTLAEFLRSGGYDRQVRRARQRYRRRRDQVVAHLAEWAPRTAVTGIAAGLHAVLSLPAGTEPAVLRKAARERIWLEGLGAFRHPGFSGAGHGGPGATAPGPAGSDTRGPAGPDGLVIGYGTPPDHAFAGALQALAGILP